MADHISLGRWGEKEAAKFLKKERYKILKTNFRCPLGEVDIIAREKKTLVFVEVKTRTRDDFAKPVEAITPDKIRRICRTARYFLKQYGIKDTDCRFDVVTVEPLAKKKKPPANLSGTLSRLPDNPLKSFVFPFCRKKDIMGGGGNFVKIRQMRSNNEKYKERCL